MGWFSKIERNHDDYIFSLPKDYYTHHQTILGKVECSFGEVLVWQPTVKDFLACGSSGRRDLAFRLSAICVHTPYQKFLEWDLSDAMKVIELVSTCLSKATSQLNPENKSV